MSLQPVSFTKPRESSPRLSVPYVAGRRDKRYWTEAERAIVAKYYPIGGVAACLAHLDPHRTPSGVYQVAHKLELSAPVGTGSDKSLERRVAKHEAPPGFDEALRAFYENGDGKKRGECNDFADKWGVHRWWMTKRATALGLTMPHKKEPPWSAAEDELLKRAPVHDLDKAATFFREHGFSRSATAINVRCKRKEISRRAARPALSPPEVSKILGVDGKTITREILQGDLKASKRADRRLPQQGGSSWDITIADLRTYIVEHLERIDLRKVEKFEFVDVLVRVAQ